MKRVLILILAGLVFTAGEKTAAAQNASTNSTSAPDWNSFKSIASKNIFDPTRSGGRRGAVRRQPVVDVFTLGGVIFDGSQGVAFFYGFNAPKKAVKTGDTINGYKIGTITFNSVELKPPTGNPIVLHNGVHLKREDGGPWTASEEAVTATPAEGGAAATPAAGTPATASSNNESDILKRLRAKRDQD